MHPPNQEDAQSNCRSQQVQEGHSALNLEASQREGINETRQYKGSGDHETVQMLSILVVFGISRQASTRASAQRESRDHREILNDLSPGGNVWLAYRRLELRGLGDVAASSHRE
jgi:hypothetical protein